MNEKTAQALWQDYSFLTKEMLKFLDKQVMELFYELMDQRERLQTLIDTSEDKGFKLSPMGKNLLMEANQDNQVILHNLQVRHNRAKRHHQVSETYNSTSTTELFNRMDLRR